MKNLISTCYVIEHTNGFVDPTIYFVRPDYIPETFLHEFENAFDAKNFIGTVMSHVEVKVSFKKAV